MFTDTDFLPSQMQETLKVVLGSPQCTEEERSTRPADKLLTADASDEELLPEANQLRQKQQMDLSRTSTASAAQIEDLQAENALLRRQLKDAHVLTVPQAQASAACLLKALKVIQEEIDTLRKTPGSTEQIIHDNVDLQRQHQEMNGRMTLLIDEINYLKNQLSAESRRRADAEERRCAQKELFHRLLMQIKRDMDQSNSQQHASIVMKDEGAPSCEMANAEDEFKDEMANAEDEFKDEMTNAHGTKTSSRFLLAEDSRRFAASRRSGKPTANGLVASSHKGNKPTFTLHDLENQS